MSAVFLTQDLLFSSRAGAAAREKAVPLDVVATTTQLIENVATRNARLVLLDLGVAGLELADLVPRIRNASSQPLRVVAYAPHVHAAHLDHARQMGCDLVLTKGQFANQLSELLVNYLAD